MYKIIEKKELAPKIYSIEIEAKRVAKSAKPGQFIIVRIDEKGERIPLTVADYNKEKGTVTIVVQAVGSSTNRMVDLKVGDYFMDFVGPLGKPSEFVEEDLESLKNMKLIFIAGGVGAAPVYPQVKWLCERGVKPEVIIGGKSKEFILLEKEMIDLGAKVYPCTDDGSYGFHGLVTNKLKELIDSGENYDRVITIGPMIMMYFVTKLTKEYKIPTIVSLNTLMVDGTGMCGACRVTVGGETKFTCVDGPEFDGHLVDFDEAMKRQTLYKTEEGKRLHKIEEEKEGHVCHIGAGENA
ncbi:MULTISPECIES: sulfide/dihydroorotate dehydrogenase-like FAD/NAD-binding protein [Clostridium]|uniref:Ferredoxin-NADP(+) reductase subunit alpha n=2 Tax=Clostridium TaxID=1485 RepID=A0A7U4LMW7_CLOSG|nr:MULTISPECIES: sulfide/dihydroorotate dehydrogenase-like FAD/NAD-binding protein [Clostridium]AJD30106.1 oxidoreductase NAD-binding domain protein [Clostridium botulinum Prevot_594]AVP59182.1 sulfide/dihydroorotate dehydrogenase-like FAD/NAD-binding protein [Clostridium botulinum]AKC62443.1 ferredoxin-NADP(+) reductase subunit alpha [Clostridium sporogenes]AKJ89708.1 NAD-binding oxidoreductase [Clostridium sporogenes]AVP63457.1 sulfide/dihydroorotate dehydrogenase-like FAD/NAD-binding protei